MHPRHVVTQERRAGLGRAPNAKDDADKAKGPDDVKTPTTLKQSKQLNQPVQSESGPGTDKLIGN
jgi:hypothetical protein